MDLGRQRLEEFFRRPEAGRGAYLSRLFAFFSEDIVRAWARAPEAPYEDLGRPTIYPASGSRGYTIDFALRQKASGEVYVAELKCEIEFNNYRFLRLEGSKQIQHHLDKAAFQAFLELAQAPDSGRVVIKGKVVQVGGAILVWGSATDAGRAGTKQDFGVTDVLTIEAMLDDLESWRPQEWEDYLAVRKRWSDELFSYLAYGSA